MDVGVQNGVVVFDTTLRDGEQMPGLAFSAAAKVEIARKLDELGVQFIEAGFPVNSPEEAAGVAAVAREVKATVAGMARVVKEDIAAALGAGVGMVDVFVSTSSLQMEKSMHATPAEVLTRSRDAVRQVKDAGVLCMFTPMDATRTDPAFLLEVCGVAAEEGADWLNLTDTVGVATPASIARMTGAVAAAFAVPVGIHCHDDFGLATANTCAAVAAGARMVQVCLNGLGERAGNASLEEVVMALKCLHGVDCCLNHQRLCEASRLLERLSGVAMAPNKPVVGVNAFTHESGIHAAGLMKDHRTFEPGLMTPEMVGSRRRLVAGKHAGRHGIGHALTEAGLQPSEDELTEIVSRVRSLGAKGKQVLSADLFAIAESVMHNMAGGMRVIELEQLVVTTGNKLEATASVLARVHGEPRVEAHTGVGPVDAAFKAVKRMLGASAVYEIGEYHVDAITGGSSAVVKVTVTVQDDAGRSATAQAAHEDIVLASVEALLTAVNQLLRLAGVMPEQAQPQERHANIA
jgi:2-isopropylmalate synthase